MSTTPEDEPGGTTSPGWTAADIPALDGRTFIVTGGNSGLGFETCRALAAKGAQVVLAARDPEKGAEAVERIRAEHPDATVETRVLDLADLDSVEVFAAGIREVDVLVNNAGVMMPPRTTSAQGYELQFAVNHLGHFALTARLLDVLSQGADPRVVTVTSFLHRRGRIHFDDLHGEHKYSRTGYYSQSKLANVVFGLELHRRLRQNGVPITSALAHPGYAATNLQSAGPTGIMKLAMKVSNRLAAQDAEMGALPQLYAAVSQDVDGGQLIGPDGRKEQKGYPTVVQPLEAARDRELAKRLWDTSEELTGVTFGLAAR
ncbi:oxidoreductase [Actinokineospora globicatena]|uniref:oxidoreductase n=1 Tax=Actinokineospora globicatena TaxID=103729 RepID=UPI0020A5D3CE|nr:oxidoreductase [Actinokineospora globicatena]MCP2301204.1 NAD(P)-dependent dehydrogenase, short-chain alcohol dehydrogenase family [Actinokineospora globicatena]GLW77160.1 short-chain dehydrogenase [Actinokineospora globicatena]GLW83994.1 short-chain dehydrogenase [Actinokineospora globicatena]